jgi:hypothetical protein
LLPGNKTGAQLTLDKPAATFCHLLRLPLFIELARELRRGESLRYR